MYRAVIAGRPEQRWCNPKMSTMPCWAMVHVLGRDAMYWYRLAQGLGRFRAVGTTIKSPAPRPKDLVADAEHRCLKGKPWMPLMPRKPSIPMRSPSAYVGSKHGQKKRYRPTRFG